MIPLPTSFKIVNQKGNQAVFEIEGLFPGYGITLGNSLRRILLSSLEGAAITEVKIEGVQHEFSTIPGVFEDVISILLNLKKLRFKIYGNEPQKATVNVKGEKEIKGKDLKLSPQLEIVNGEQHIATLTSGKARFDMEVTVQKGVGYEPAEMRKNKKLDIGQISIDAIYTPVRKVSFKTENMRRGKRIDFDKLILELETDGTVSPREAFKEALIILQKHTNFMISSLEEKKKKEPKTEFQKFEPSSAITPAIPKKKIKLSFQDIGLSPKIISILNANKVKSVAGLLRKKEEDLKSMKGMGEKSIKEIKKSLGRKGVQLKD